MARKRWVLWRHHPVLILGPRRRKHLLWIEYMLRLLADAIHDLCGD